MRNKGGELSDAVSGLVFVEIATGAISEEEGDLIIFDGGTSSDVGVNIFDGGSAKYI